MHILHELLKIIRDYTTNGISKVEEALLTDPYQPTEKEGDILLNRISMGIIGGNGFQRITTKIHRRYLAFKIMTLFGFSKTAVPLAHKLVQQATNYHQHQIAADLCRFLAKHYAIYVGKMSIAEKFQKQAVMHHEIFGREIKYNWSYQKIRSRFNANEFDESSEDIKEALSSMEPNYKESIHLMFIHHELKFFLCYELKDIEGQKAACYSAIEAFKELPYSHDLVINIFCFHLIDILIRENDLASAELVILNRIEDQIDLGSHEFRFQSLLLEVTIKKGDVPASREILDFLQESPKFRVYEKKMEELEAALIELEGSIKKKVVPKKKKKSAEE